MNRHIHEIDSNLEAAWLLRDSKQAETRANALDMLDRSRHSGYRRGEALALTTLSYLDFRIQHYDMAFVQAFDALSILEASGVEPWLPRLYNVLALIYGEVGEQALERDYLQQQIELSQRLGDLEWEATGYHDLAIHLSIRDLPAAQDMMGRALTMFQNANLLDGIAYALSNLGEFSSKQAEWQLAHDLSYQALVIFREIRVHQMHMITAGNLASICAKLNRMEEAESYLHEAMEVSNTHLSDWSRDVWHLAGDYAMAIGEYQRARDFYEKALRVSEKTSALPYIYNCHARLAACYEALGEAAKALQHLKRFFTLKEQVMNAENELKLRALEVIHRTRAAQREADLERQKSRELQRYVHELEILQRQLREQSMRDALTHLYNRRALIEQGDLQVQMALRYNTSLSVAMLDIDHFKQINDTFLHTVGDQVLIHLAAIARHAMRTIDIIARYGGEEFVILLPETELDQALIAIERLRLAVENHDWAVIHPRLRVTVSIGLAAIRDAKSLESILYRADAKLYEAKHLGRNRTSM